MSGYAPFDQEKHLGEPPWSGPELDDWEEAHGHDVRQKCLPEYGCLTYYTEWERLLDEVERLDRDERITAVQRDDARAEVENLRAELERERWNHERLQKHLAEMSDWEFETRTKRDRYREALEELRHLHREQWGMCLVCHHDSDVPYGAPEREVHPCPTYRTIDAALDGSDDAG